MNYDDFLAIGLPIIIASSCLLVTFVVTFIVVKISRKKHRQKNEDDFAHLLASLGGRDNILTITSSRSRITIKLNNPDLIDRDVLKECGVTSVIQMSEKISLVFSQDATRIAERIKDLF